MSELRWNPTIKEWISYATHRQDRTFHPPPEYCPLCPTKGENDFPTKVRILAKGEHFTTFIPFYARFPYEAHVYARRCVTSIAD